MGSKWFYPPTQNMLQMFRKGAIWSLCAPGGLDLDLAAEPPAENEFQMLQKQSIWDAFGPGVLGQKPPGKEVGGLIPGPWIRCVPNLSSVP